MNKTILLLSLLTMISCEKPPVCTTGKDHEYDKWKPDGRTSLGGQPNMIRNCKKCGWQQQKLTEMP